METKKKIEIISVKTEDMDPPPNSNDPEVAEDLEEEIKTIKNQHRQWTRDISKVANSQYIKLKPTSNLFVWNVLLKAKPDYQKLWGDKWYRAQLVFFKNFPDSKPELRFPKGFQNLFVYPIAPFNLCYSSFNLWTSTDNIMSVLPGVIDVLFEEPALEINANNIPAFKKGTVGDGNVPANPQLARTYISNRQEYEQKIKQQVNSAGYDTEDLTFDELSVIT